jgi:hypothetical protein
MDETKPDSSHDHGARSNHGKPAGTEVPRWVKVFIAIGAVLVVLVVVALLGGHGPGRHMPHSIGEHGSAGVAGELQ